MPLPTIYDELDNRWWGDAEILDDICIEEEIKRMSKEDLRIAEPINDWCIVKNKKRQPKNVQVKDQNKNKTRIKGQNHQSNKNTDNNRRDTKKQNTKKQNTRKYANGVAPIYKNQEYKLRDTKRQEIKKQNTKKQETKKKENKKKVLEKQVTDKQVTEKQVNKKQLTEKQVSEKQVTEKQVTEKQVTEKQDSSNKTNNSQKNKKLTVKKSQIKKIGTVTNVVKGGCGFIKDDDLSNMGIYVFAETKKISIGDRVQFTTSQDNIEQHFQKAVNVRSIKEKK